MGLAGADVTLLLTTLAVLDVGKTQTRFRSGRVGERGELVVVECIGGRLSMVFMDILLEVSAGELMVDRLDGPMCGGCIGCR